MESLGSIVGNIVPSVRKYWNYHKEADQHVKNLKRKWELLERWKDDIKTKFIQNFVKERNQSKKLNFGFKM